MTIGLRLLGASADSAAVRRIAEQRGERGGAGSGGGATCHAACGMTIGAARVGAIH
ncbi:hypothetical protein FHX82_004691 [Amycolatopsis bartoniae]|uniref:hypothetical protein n=1 Tax=Amycolatopsis bartoniae TaxID=941986 RepID=UPI001606D601|nr:hypothetical protein [Amycolatopsis bartoniae]MBB2937618.1 hypothetical protein [Amycolatopsis bartoniae]